MMSTTPALDDLTVDQDIQDIQYVRLEERLLVDYGDAEKVVVHRAVEQERGRFADARVHAFVPVLVERSVRARLGAPRSA